MSNLYTLDLPAEPDEIDYCACPLWEPCTCGAEAPLVSGYEEMHPWLVDRRAETSSRRLARHRAAS